MNLETLLIIAFALLLDQYIQLGCDSAYIRGTDLFQTVFCNNAEVLHKALARKAVFTRLLDDRQGVRFGLPERAQWFEVEQIFKMLAEREIIRLGNK